MIDLNMELRLADNSAIVSEIYYEEKSREGSKRICKGVRYG